MLGCGRRAAMFPHLPFLSWSVVKEETVIRLVVALEKADALSLVFPFVIGSTRWDFFGAWSVVAMGILLFLRIIGKIKVKGVKGRDAIEIQEAPALRFPFCFPFSKL